MPTSEEKLTRILEMHDARLSRLEDANTQEAVPNPLIDVRDESRSTDAVSVSSQATGSGQWGADKWGATEWNLKERSS